MTNCVVCMAELAAEARFCPSCGAEQPRAAEVAEGSDPFIGQLVAQKFRIESLLGVGGMGKVYKATQTTLDKPVVIKILHEHLGGDPNTVQRFQREAKAASRLSHPNSIQVIDFGQDASGVLFMAIEYLEGVDLYTLLKDNFPLSEDRISRIMIQVCSALAEAHDQNVIHRDLKPENIMIINRRGQNDFVKVLDFGIAKLQDAEEPGQALTQAGMVCGTPEYMSPEQARGLALDARSDIYALGVLLFQLVTGELPFFADTPIGIVTKHILEQPPRPTEKYPQLNISPAMESVILTAMAKEADDRYAHVMQMAEALNGVLRGERATTQGVDARNLTVAMSTSATQEAVRRATASQGVVAPAETPVTSSVAAPGSTVVAPAAAIAGHAAPTADAMDVGGGLVVPPAKKPLPIAAIAGVVVAAALIGGGSIWALRGAPDEPVAALDAGVVTEPSAPDAGVAVAVPAPVKPKPKPPKAPVEPPVRPKPQVKPKSDPVKPVRAVSGSRKKRARRLVVEAGKASGKPAQSEKLAREALRLDPSSTAAAAALAFSLRSQGRHSEACKVITDHGRRKGGAKNRKLAGLKKRYCR